MTTQIASPKKPSLAKQECWHVCPLGVSLACLERKAVALDHGYPADWQHPVSSIAKLDEFEKVCPDCQEAQKNGTHA